MIIILIHIIFHMILNCEIFLRKHFKRRFLVIFLNWSTLRPIDVHILGFIIIILWVLWIVWVFWVFRVSIIILTWIFVILWFLYWLFVLNGFEIFFPITEWSKRRCFFCLIFNWVITRNYLFFFVIIVFKFFHFFLFFL
jgi:hypothetical protein